MNYLLPIDVVALLSLFWVAQAALAGGHAVESWRDTFLTLGLVVLKVSGFIGAIVVAMEPETVVSWWTRGVIYSGATVAAWFYDYRFGIARHWRMAIRAFCEIPGDICNLPHNVASWFRAHPLKRKTHR